MGVADWSRLQAGARRRFGHQPLLLGQQASVGVRAYLKACVNYLVLFGERFGADPADCGLNPDKAAYLRSVAEQIVLGNEGDYFIER